jgi:hypothetical protein
VRCEPAIDEAGGVPFPDDDFMGGLVLVNDDEAAEDAAWGA